MATVSIQFRKGAEHDGKPSAIEHDGAEISFVTQHDGFGPHIQIVGDGYRVCIALDGREAFKFTKEMVLFTGRVNDWWQP